MGALGYGHAEAFPIADSTLAHLAIVIVSKLRRGEPFMLSLDSADGRSALWVHPAAMLRFRYSDHSTVVLDRLRLEHMMRDAHKPGGVTVESLPSAQPLAIVDERLAV